MNTKNSLSTTDGDDLLDRLSQYLPSVLMDRVSEALSARVSHHKVTMVVETNGKTLAQAVAESLIESGAKNYTCDVIETNKGDVLVTAQFVEGKTPADRVHESEAEIARLRTEVEGLRKQLGETAQCLADVSNDVGGWAVEEVIQSAMNAAMGEGK